MPQDLYYYWHERYQTQEIARCVFDTLCTHPLLALEIRHEFYQQGQDTGPHQHIDFYALYIIRGGKGVHLIDNHPYGIARGDVYLLPPGTVHAYRDYSSLQIDASYFQTALFSQSELSALKALSGFWQLFITHEQSESNISAEHRFHLSPEQYQIVKEIISELRNEFLNATQEGPLLTHNQFFRLLIWLARWQSAQRIKTSLVRERSPSHSTLAPVLQYCEEHFQEPLTVPGLASMVNLSTSRFAEIFVQEVGVSPAAYLRRLRLERAQTLLRTTSLSNTVIAHQTGFNTLAHFSRSFQALYRMTPTAYRNLFRTNKNLDREP